MTTTPIAAQIAKPNESVRVPKASSEKRQEPSDDDPIESYTSSSQSQESNDTIESWSDKP